MTHIDFQAQDDHDLLVQAVTGINATNSRLDKINGTLQRHEERIASCEKIESYINRHTKVNWQMLSVVIALIGGLIYATAKLV
jgi:hypothetical protein